jgi:hypothetical protein
MERTFVLQVPSVANPGATSLQFAEMGSAGGSDGPFAPLWLPSAGSAFVWVGAGPGYAMPVEHPPTNWVLGERCKQRGRRDELHAAHACDLSRQRGR